MPSTDCKQKNKLLISQPWCYIDMTFYKKPMKLLQILFDCMYVEQFHVWYFNGEKYDTVRYAKQISA